MSLLSGVLTHIADLDLTICLINATNGASTLNLLFDTSCHWIAEKTAMSRQAV
jgi:hypothetical protein